MVQPSPHGFCAQICEILWHVDYSHLKKGIHSLLCLLQNGKRLKCHLLLLLTYKCKIYMYSLCSTEGQEWQNCRGDCNYLDAKATVSAASPGAHPSCVGVGTDLA